MRLLTRYILREVVSYALLGAVLFTFVLFMRDLPKILELVVRDSASLTDVLRIFAYTLPNTLTVTLPTAVLAGILLGLSRLAADSEVTAMRACGIGAFTFVRIVSILAFAALGLGLFNALYFAPSAASNLLKLEDQLKTSQASFEVQPRVFYEDFKNYVLYVQDVRPAAGAAAWHHIFLADLTQPANPNVITADQALVSNSGSANQQALRLHLLEGGQHQISPTDPNQYDISTFASTDLPLQFDSQDDTHVSRSDTPLHALSLRELLHRARAARNTPAPLNSADARAARIELNSRFSYPFACLVLMLIGVPLGLSSRRGGKSTGVVLTLLLVFAYYLLSLIGDAFAKSGKLSPALGVWAANLIFTAFGLLLLQQLAGTGFLIHFFNSIAASLGRMLSHIAPSRIQSTLARLTCPASRPTSGAAAAQTASIHASADDAPNSIHPAHAHQSHPTLAQRLRSLFNTNFPLLLDEYVMRAYATNLIFSLGAFILLFIVFTFFELIGDIVRNHTALVTVGDYLLNLIPYIVSTVTPLCSLLAVLITFSSLNRSSELTAMKATGISLYRVVAPIVVLAALLSAALFAFNESYLPNANRRQEALRAEIKGKPAQTFLLPGRQFISGQTAAGSPDRIFYYQAFDSDRDIFASLTVFEFDPQSFTLQRRIFAKSVRWDTTANQWAFENGWQRTFANQTVASYQPFTLASFPEIHEQPTYFIKEEKQSQEMTYGELSNYIADLSQSGFDTIRLRVQLDRKLADPAITLVMAILAVPFALFMGKRGGIAGIATAIGVAISYLIVAYTFSGLGNINTLPPLLAAWSPDLLFAIAGSYLLLRTPT
jgi:LPS export ABC transporter permease LptF/LPS export ABC transporter permease LptG